MDIRLQLQKVLWYKNGRALKLVDRLEFSAANFSTDKNWDK